MDELLVLMTKGGETLEVHPSCVADHKRCGWVEAPPPAESQPAEPAPKARKGAAKE